jgi:hypothetical protein
LLSSIFFSLYPNGIKFLSARTEFTTINKLDQKTKMCRIHIYNKARILKGPMNLLTDTPTHGEAAGISSNAVLNNILSRLLALIARLCLANGMTFASVEEVLKKAFVQEANALQPGAPLHGKVSRISTTTGLTRREVRRLVKEDVPVRPAKPPLSTELFARWTTGQAWRDLDGKPYQLKRQGPAPSFEALAQSVTRDVHPRSMLDELIRLGLASYDEEHDSVSLTCSEFVPKGDAQQVLGLLCDNVGDHFEAAVSNVLQDGTNHLEQAVFADELSSESIETLRPLIMNCWQTLRDTMVPTITDLIESDRIAGRIQDQRMRFGLYTFAEAIAAVETEPNKSTEQTNRRAASMEDHK